ncbi:dihydromonapterin reductase [Parendozoicomonas haliclonae]|uniref:Dihydromonapterin reductase n=1 Tax=Parendozoicomonas haliclonae TaxID=1960125 RepID=A0A1X7AFS8_9GAMM|nr:dihydromonapterin reductase [Parendozoicomonas haliclonae]SMA37081.1 Dihydrofolate reductase FolM [Parendozoicomonas haliclonae]
MPPAHSESILITGASRRLGLYNAKKCLEAGFHVIATYRHRTKGIDELEQAGALVLPVNMDSPEEVAGLIAQIEQSTSSLRAIIHNASGWLSDSENPEDSEPLDTLFRVHMQAPWLINRSLYPLLQKCRGTADIIHMTDYNALRGSIEHAAYAATKAGLESLTRSFAKMYAPKVKVNAIAPYLIIMNEGDHVMAEEGTLPVPPMGLEPGEDVIWQTIDYVMKNSYVTGTTLSVDGGMSLK